MRIERNDDYIAVFGDFKVLSSAVYNGGFRRTKTIINLGVPPDFNEEPVSFYKSFISSKGFESPIGMMTAASMKNAKTVERGDVIGITTAGLCGTINIILLINKDLIESAMVNAVIVATEAKAAALSHLNIRKGSEVITGTPTDSIVVACYGSENIKYAGPATAVGNQIYEVARESVESAMSAQEGIVAGRSILERLEEIGITLGEMVSSAMELYIPDENKDSLEVERRLRSLIEKQCKDVNVSSLLASALCLEDELRSGRLGIKGDPSYVVSDELIGLMISEYIAGSLGKFNFVRYDMKKPGILKELSVFMDDAIGGLIAGCMTKLFDEWE